MCAFCVGIPPAPGISGKDPIELLMQQLDGSPVPSESASHGCFDSWTCQLQRSRL